MKPVEVQPVSDPNEIILEEVFCEKSIRHSESFSYGQLRLFRAIENIGMLPKFSSNAELRVGFYYTLRGKWEVYRDEKQFKVSSIIAERAPRSSDGIKKYLLSYDSIGPVKAQKIIDGLGEQAFEKIIADASTLLPWVKEDVAKKIRDDLISDPEQFEIKKNLLSIGVSNAIIEKIFFYLGKNAISTIKNTPYDLITIEGIGFKTCDSIALKIGNTSLDDPERLRHIALHVAANLVEAESGDTVFTLETLKLKCKGALATLNSFKVDLLIDRVQQMIDDQEFKSISISGKTYYQTKESYFDEKAIASNVMTRIGKSDKLVSLDPISNRLSSMSADQLQALEGLISERMCILTGGPGTGKSYITNSAKIAFRAQDFTVGVVAPTGKAASIVGGITIHSALGFGRSGVWGPTKTIDSHILIVDECSMIDNDLMLMLLNHVSKDTRIILVGDPDQLPPIGKGEPFRQMIRSGKVPVYQLTTIHRQKGDSAIPYLAQQIKNGEKISIDDESVKIIEDKKLERRKIERTSDDQQEASPLEALTDKLVKTYLSMMISAKQAGENIGVEDVIIIVPYSSIKMKPNATEINNRIQEFRFAKKPDKYIWNKNGKRFAIGDRVIRTKNRLIEIQDPDSRTVFTVLNANGDCGVVVDGSEEEGVLVKFDRSDIPTTVLIEKKEIGDLRLAYALTCHKFQGSQSRFVIVSMHSSNKFVQDKRAVYTAITRASEGVIIVTPSLADALSLYKQKAEDRKSLVAYRMKTFKPITVGSEFVDLSDQQQTQKSIDESSIQPIVAGVRKLNIEDNNGSEDQQN